MLPDQLHKYIPEYSSEWFKAEEALKSFERLSTTVLMASVQELRYAGRRFAQVLNTCHQRNGSLSTDEISALEVHLVEAIQNCIKARHDAIDASVQFVHKRMNTLAQAVGILEVRAHFPHFNLLEQEIKEIDKKIVAARADRRNLDANYAAILTEHGAKLVDFYEKLSQSEFAIRDSLKAQKKINHRNLFISSLVGFVLGIFASVIASHVDRWMTASGSAPPSSTASGNQSAK
jgi:hypothetical protein